MKLKPFTSIYLALAMIIGALVAGPAVGYAKDKKDKGDNGNGNQPQQPAKNQGGNPGAPGVPGGQRGVGPGQNQSGGQPNNPLGNGPGRRNGGGLDNGSQGNANRNNKPDNKLPDSQPSPEQRASKADKVDKTPPAPKVDRDVSPKPVLSKHQTASGFEETTPSGRVRTRDEKKD